MSVKYATTWFIAPFENPGGGEETQVRTGDRYDSEHPIVQMFPQNFSDTDPTPPPLPQIPVPTVPVIESAARSGPGSDRITR